METGERNLATGRSIEVAYTEMREQSKIGELIKPGMGHPFTNCPQFYLHTNVPSLTNHFYRAGPLELYLVG